jgi:hypothetical protein
MSSYYSGRRSTERAYSYPHPHAHSLSQSQSQSSLYTSSSPISDSVPVLPPVPAIADDAPATGLGLDRGDSGFSQKLQSQPTPTLTPPSPSSLASIPPPLRDPPAPPAVRPQSLQQSRAVTSPAGSLPRQTHKTPSSPLAALSVPYASITAQAKPFAGHRPLPAESTVNGVPQHAKAPKQKPDPHSSKLSKGKFNLLNPVNLLMRRRSAQAVETLERSASKSLAIPPMDLPDGYDPRIRGNVVHDFSAPRSRRTPSYDPSIEVSPKPSTANDSINSNQGDANRKSMQHTPVFVEHIDSEPDERRIHAETLANNDFVARNSWNHSGESLAMPRFGRESQQSESDLVTTPASSSSSAIPAAASPSDLYMSTFPSAPASTSVSASSSSEMGATSGPDWQYHEPERVYSPVPPSPTPLPIVEPVHHELDATEQNSFHPEQSSPRLYTEASPSLPKHTKSTASRFSFQIANDSIAEEKLLEDRHKLRQSQVVQSSQSFDDADADADADYEDEDTFDEDAMYDHDEMEDAVSNGLYEHQNSALTQNLSAMTLDSNQRHISMASSSSLYSTSPVAPVFQNPLRCNPPQEQVYQSLPAASFGTATTQSQKQPASPSSTNSFYFDDGIIDQADDSPEVVEEAFDEDNFDDPSYLKRPNQPPHTTLIQQTSVAPVHNVDGYPFLIQNPGAGYFSATSPYSEESSHHGDLQQDTRDVQEAEDEVDKHDSQQGPLDSHNMSAYHIALAQAAHRAAADGKFTRSNSVAASDSVYSEDQGITGNDYHLQQLQQRQQQLQNLQMQQQQLAQLQQQHEQYQHQQQGQYQQQQQQQEQLMQQQQHQQALQVQMQMQMQMPTQRYMPSQAPMQMQAQPQTRQSYMSGSTHVSTGSYSAFDFGFSDGATIEDTYSSPEFPSDDFAFDDSDLISAANSEALANDEDDFYSQEFGFYARARPGSDPAAVEAVNGGYFGAPGIEIIRQKSLREPNLTPITERSEFSTRNSYIGPFNPMAAAFPSPGIPASTAARMSQIAWQHLQEDEMTLADLRKLKQGAFGSSSNSVNSISSSLGAGASHSPIPGSHNAPNGYFMPRGGVPMALHSDSNPNSHYNPSNHSSSPLVSPIHMSMPNSMSNSQTFSSPQQLSHAHLVPEIISTPQKSLPIQPEFPATPVPAKKAADAAAASERQAYQSHSRSGSGADNITYVSERDSAGVKRWVLERRRTSEAGFLELIGREVVEGGRI